MVAGRLPKEGRKGLNLNSELHQLFAYSNGELIRKVSTSSRARAGDIAGNKRPDGYKEVRFMGRKYLVHRMIFCMFYGYVPNEIDHINGDKSDNRIENLRAVTRKENSLNQRRRGTNTSGYKGVTWSKTAKKWLARANTYCKHKCIGFFDTKEKAAEALDIFRKKYHGEFANNG